MKRMTTTALLLLLTLMVGPLPQAFAQAAEDPQEQIESLSLEDEAEAAAGANLYDVTWKKSYKREGYANWLRKILKDKAGNTYTVGFVRSTRNELPQGFTLQKRTPSGELVWAKRMLAKYEFILVGAVMNRFGELYIAGHFEGKDDFVRIWRWDLEEGKVLGQIAFDYEAFVKKDFFTQARDVQVDHDGNVYLLLQSTNPRWRLAATVVKLNRTLSKMVWSQDQYVAKSSGELYPKALRVTEEGRVSVLSYRSKDQRSGRLYLHQLTSEGTLAWARPYSDPDTLDFAMSENLLMTTDSSGRIYVAATARRNPKDGSDTSILTFCVTPKGQIAWQRVHEGGTEKYPAFPSDLALDGKGGVYVSGTNLIRVSKYGARYDQLLIKYEASTGKAQWIQRYRPAPLEGSYTFNLGLEVDFAGNVYTVSHSDTDPKNRKPLLAILGFRPDGRKFFERRVGPAFTLREGYIPGSFSPGADLVISGKAIYLAALPQNTNTWFVARFDR